MAKKLSKPHPESLSEVSRIKPTEQIESFVHNLSRDVEDEKGSVLVRVLYLAECFFGIYI